MMQSRSRRASAVGGACMISALSMLFATPALAAESEALTIYNSQDEGLVEALAAAFEKQTGVKVAFRNNGAPALARQIIDEGDYTPADIF